ncbi:MAG: aminopeptidase, partial [Polaromonas sp.]|nr:aminopeptidase [Polaromonas sp.]
AVERLGGQRWLDSQASEAVRKEYAAFNQRRQQFRALALATRRELEAIYEPNVLPAQGIRRQSAIKSMAKEETMKNFRDNYAQLKAAWGGFAGYDPWVARANNASFGAQAAYDELVPGFEALFVREAGDWQRFYDAVRRLAALPQDARHQALKTNQTETK